MMQVSTREEDENELSLELSIGRKCYDKKTSTSQMLPRDFAPNRNIISNIISPQSQLHGDLQFKQALRRKKRDEKRGKGENACCVDEIEEEEEAEMPPRKKEKCLSFNNISPHDNNVVSNLKIKMNREAALHAMQYVPFTNGFVYPPPCTNGFSMDNNRTRGNYEALDKRVSFDIRSFRPYSSSCRNLEMTSTVVNDASSGGSSPAVSDHHTSTLQGGSSSISFQHESRNVFSAGNGSKRSEIKNWDSMGMCSNEVKVRTKANHTVNTTLLSNIQVRESRCSEEPKPAATLEDPTLSTKNPVDSALLKKNTSNAVITNPLKTQIECNGPSALPQMPCVSTTGNGPNGKTITGFLYKYTKTEVCIVCVCHGTSFSPADFVKHAGGVDVEHPLRHITIVSSDLT